MTTDTQIAPAAAQGVTIHRTVGGISQEKRDLIKRTIAKGASDDELSLFLIQARRTGLDPFSHQIHAVSRWDSREKRPVMAIQVGIDGFRVIASRTGAYNGQDGPWWCGDDGVWHDVWLSAKPPVAAKVVVFRKDVDHGFVGIARTEAYVGKTSTGEANTMWTKMADLMIAKCAEALALRKAFPNDLSGLYTDDEMQQASSPVATTPPPEPTLAQRQSMSMSTSTLTPPTNDATPQEQEIKFCDAHQLDMRWNKYRSTHTHLLEGQLGPKGGKMYCAGLPMTPNAFQELCRGLGLVGTEGKKLSALIEEKLGPTAMDLIREGKYVELYGYLKASPRPSGTTSGVEYAQLKGAPGS